jgi:hypothetical protein
MSPATALENVGGPTPPTPATLPMRTRVNLMKAIMVERVSNAARARYALRASPNARQRKDRTITISLQEKEDQLTRRKTSRMTATGFDRMTDIGSGESGRPAVVGQLLWSMRSSLTRAAELRREP